LALPRCRARKQACRAIPNTGGKGRTKSRSASPRASLVHCLLCPSLSIFLCSRRGQTIAKSAFVRCPHDENIFFCMLFLTTQFIEQKELKEREEACICWLKKKVNFKMNRRKK